jgi:membrane protein
MPPKSDHARNELWTLSRDAIDRLFADEAIPLAGNIAFRIVFSAFPFLIFLVTLGGFFGSADLAESLVNWLIGVAPPNIVAPLAPEIRSILTEQRAGLLSLSAALTVWSAMGGVDSVRTGLNRAYDLKDPRSFYWLYLQNVLFIICAAVVLLALALLIVLAPVAITAIDTFFPAARPLSEVFDQLRLPVAILLLAIGLTAAHKFLPARRPRLAELWPGVTLTVIVWVLLAIGYSKFLANFSTFASTYAGLSGLFAAMFFLYLAAIVLIFGGEVNRVIALHKEANSPLKAADRIGETALLLQSDVLPTPPIEASGERP